MRRVRASFPTRFYRYSTAQVPVRCTEPHGIEPVTVYVSAGYAHDAREAATKKIMDKYLPHQYLETKWAVTGDPVEA
jgi:hypothetical protein